MLAELRKKTQETIDTMRELVDGCQLVMLVDQETGLVLCQSAAVSVSYDQLEYLAEGARKYLKSALVTALSGIDKDTECLVVTRFGASGVTAVIQNLECRDEVLVCQCESMPSRTDLMDAANEVFELSSTAEAA